MPLSNYGNIEKVVIVDLYRVLRDAGLKDVQCSLVVDTTVYLIKKVLDSKNFFDEHGYGSYNDRH